MNALAHIRPQPIASEPLQAFRLEDDGRLSPLRCDTDDLQTAVQQTAILCLHKERFAIRQTCAGRDVLHVYAVKQRANATWNGQAMIRPLYADWLLDIALHTLPAASDVSPLASLNHAPAFEAGRSVTGGVQ